MDPQRKTATDPESRISFPGWKVVLAGFCGVMVSFVAVVPYTFSLFLKPLSLAFGWHREAISAGFSVAALTMGAASPGLGFLLDRWGPRRVILPCFMVFSLAYASLALLTPHLIQFYLAFFFIGLVGSGTAFLGYSRAISTWFDRRRGRALSIMLAGGACGAMIMPLIAQAAITHYGWRTAFAVLAILPLVVGVPITACFVREQPEVRERAQIAVDVGESVGKALGGRVMWIIAATVCLSAIGVNGAIAHLSALLTDRGVSTQGAAYSIAIMGATGLVGRFMIGPFLDRFFGPRIYQAMLLMAVIGIALLSVARTLATGMTAAALIGLSTGGEADITPYMISRYFGLKRFSTLYAFTHTAHALGAAIGPLFVGWIFDSFGSYRPAAIQLLALPSFVPCLVMFLLPRYHPRYEMRKPALLAPIAETPAAEIAQ
ncbi:MAG: MFS transporter [Terracidiphilus sp.]